MSKQDTCIRALCKELGENYRICTIDLERVIYRDFGNGFNVEISGMHTSSLKKTATIYLRFGDTNDTCIIVKKIAGVPRYLIHEKVEELLVYSNELLAKGYDTRDKLFHMKYPETRVWNIARGGINMLHKIFYGSKPKLSQEDRTMFSRGKFACKMLLQKSDGQPVVISQCKDEKHPVWRVDYGFSSLFFHSYDEAMAYCKDHFLQLDERVV